MVDEIPPEAFGGDNVEALANHRERDARPSDEWTASQMLTHLLADIQAGLCTPTKMYVAIVEDVEDNGQRHSFMCSNMKTLEVYGLLAKHLVDSCHCQEQ